VVGNVSSKSKVVIGSTGHIKGDIYSQNADISGAHFGSCYITDLLFLKSTSKVNGNINTGKLVVESGAIFTGNCNMGAIVEKPIKVDVNFKDKQPKEEKISEEIVA
ncbi:MAG: polymer-forming cytoskeletal protein, partial [Flavobacterium sp.]|nr:polymer-forming cytoskeletal protein [Flavobacterium sp.]